MSGLLVGAAGAAIGAGALAAGVRARHAQQVARRRLHRRDSRVVDPPRAEGRSILRRPRWVPPLIAFALFVVAASFGLPLVHALSAGVMGGVLAHLGEDHRAQTRELRVEGQLAEAIDLMVASLSAGAGPLDALESAAAEVASPLADELAGVAARIRLGDSPPEAYGELARRVPLENVHLFAFTLTVHGESGGSLAPTLATVGESIRDLVDMRRTAKSHSAQAQASVLGILAITWFLAAMMWRTAPERFEEFVRAPFGASLTAGAVLLQAVGMAWITRLSRLRF